MVVLLLIYGSSKTFILTCVANLSWRDARHTIEFR